MNIFAICGDSGAGKSTFCTVLKNAFKESYILECDRYHKWERGDENWKRFTHLNPEANNLDKLKKDILDLKSGININQVDYCHTSGKFTKQEVIKPSKNLLVCGLHSLYIDVDYTVKIYIDTDPELKKKWKVNRDVKNRGYSVTQVLEGIKKREADYIKYLLPQREKADLIISFSSAKELILKLSFNEKFLLEKFVDFLVKSRINYELEFNTNFNSITFKEYRPPMNSLYDYVLILLFKFKREKINV